MKLLKTCLVTMAVLTLVACSEDGEDKGGLLPEVSRVVKLNIKGGDFLDMPPIGLVLVGKEASAQYQYKADFLNNKRLVVPADDKNVALLPENGTSVDIYAYIPYSEGMNREKLTVPLDVHNLSVDEMAGFRVAKYEKLAGPVDTAVSVVFKEQLCGINIQVFEKKGDSFEEMKDITVSVTNVAFVGEYSLVKQELESEEMQNEFVLQKRNMNGILSCVILPTKKPIEVIVKNKAGKVWTISQMHNSVTGENQPIIPFAGMKVSMIFHISNEELKASPIATCFIRE